MTQAFSIPRSIIYGENALEHLSTLSGKKAALVTGGSSMKRFGFLDKAVSELNKEGMECIIIDNVEPNPSIKTVWRGAKAMQAFGPDWIVAIGGGSALDAAKVMWCFYEHPQLKFEDILPVGSMPALRNKARFVAIPSPTRQIISNTRLLPPIWYRISPFSTPPFRQKCRRTLPFIPEWTF